MNFDILQKFCNSLAGTTEDIKWGHHPTFCVAEKIYVIVSLDGGPVKLTVKTTAELFEPLCAREDIIPAPYMARYHWVQLSLGNSLTEAEVKELVRDSYDLVFKKLPKRQRDKIAVISKDFYPGP